MTAMIRYVSNCTELRLSEWERLMKGARPCSYEGLVAQILTDEPGIYHSLLLNLFNPYAGQCAETDTHYILVHSIIEYFFEKVN